MGATSRDHARDVNVEVAIYVFGDSSIDNGRRTIERCLVGGVQWHPFNFLARKLRVIVAESGLVFSACRNPFQGLFAGLKVKTC